MAKIHYLHPVLGHHACGMARSYSEATNDISKVTCGACLNTITGKNRGGRPPKNPDGAIRKIAFSISDKAFQRLQQIPKGKRSDFVSRLIENN